MGLQQRELIEAITNVLKMHRLLLLQEVHMAGPDQRPCK